MTRAYEDIIDFIAAGTTPESLIQLPSLRGRQILINQNKYPHPAALKRMEEKPGRNDS